MSSSIFTPLARAGSPAAGSLLARVVRGLRCCSVLQYYHRMRKAMHPKADVGFIPNTRTCTARLRRIFSSTPITLKPYSTDIITTHAQYRFMTVNNTSELEGYPIITNK